MSSSSSESKQYRKRDPDSAEITALQKGLYDSMTPIAYQYGDNWQEAQNAARGYKQNYDDAYGGLSDLTTSGNLPSGVTDAMDGYITRSMNKSLGTALSNNAAKGVINSSIMNRSMNEIGNETADAFAKNYSDMYGKVGSNYGTLMDQALKAKSNVWSDLDASVDPLLKFYQIARESEDKDDYDTVVEQDSGS